MNKNIINSAYIQTDREDPKEKCDRGTMFMQKSFDKLIARQSPIHCDFYNENENTHFFVKHCYSITKVSSKSMYTTSLANCTSFIVVGLDKISGKNIGFMTHQNTDIFVDSNTFGLESFNNSLHCSLEEFLALVDHTTIDSLLFGGNFYTDDLQRKYEASLQYFNSLQFSREYPTTVLSGPKKSPTFSHIYLDTGSRRTYTETAGCYQSTNLLESFSLHQRKRYKKLLLNTLSYKDYLSGKESTNSIDRIYDELESNLQSFFLKDLPNAEKEGILDRVMHCGQWSEYLFKTTVDFASYHRIVDIITFYEGLSLSPEEQQVSKERIISILVDKFPFLS